jgi:capsular exopolysaccharide synthesis family protein
VRRKRHLQLQEILIFAETDSMSKYFDLLHEAQIDKELLACAFPAESPKSGIFEILSKTTRGQELLAPLRPAPHAEPEPEGGMTPGLAWPGQASEERLNRVALQRDVPGNGHGAADAVPRSSLVPSRARAFLRAAGTRLGILSNVRALESHRALDLKAITRQEEIKLVRRVFLSADSRLNKMIVFFGLENGKGSAHVCARAAATLALQVQGSVCVVDANLKSPLLHHYFGAENVVGLSEAVLQGGVIRDYAQQTEIKNLWLIPSGQSDNNSEVLHDTELVRARFIELRRQFEYILINAPSLGAFANAIPITRMADGVIGILEANSTSRETAQRLKERLEATNSRVLGVVLNNRTFPIPESVYRRL